MIRRAVVVALGVWACTPPEVAPAPEPAAATATRSPAWPRPAADCEQLAADAASDPTDARLLALLCPEHELTPALERAALLEVRDVVEAQRLADRLAGGSEARALALLAARVAPAARATELPDPVGAVVLPPDDAVRSRIARAHATFVDDELPPADRTRAAAWLARAHAHAFAALGPDAHPPLRPLARMLAAAAIQYDRTFARMLALEHVAGLDGLRTETGEIARRAALALDLSPHEADDALVLSARVRGARGLDDDGGGAPIAEEIDRLLDARLVDLAIDRGLAAGVAADGYGVAPVADRLRAGLLARELDELVPRLDARLLELQARAPAPPAEGPRVFEPVRVGAWVTPALVAALARAWVEGAPAQGLARRHALGRAIGLLQERPSAARILAADAELGAPLDALAMAVALAWSPDDLGAARRAVAADTRWPATDRDGREAALRRRVALAAREHQLGRNVQR
jgi:hypothetical protein